MKAKIKWGSIIFIGILVMTWYLVFRNYPIREMTDILKNVNPGCIGIGFLCMLVFVVCEGVNIRLGLAVQGYSVSVLKGIHYAIIGFFFSSITPASTGGQPVQLLCMHRDGIPAANASLSLLMELCSYQTVVIGLGTVSMFLLHDVLWTLPVEMRVWILVGVCGNILYQVLVLLAVFSGRIPYALLRVMTFFCRLFHIKRTDDLQRKMLDAVEQYRKGAEILKESKRVVIRMLFTTAVQMLAMYSIPFWVWRANGYGSMKLIGLQAILHVAVSAIPLPGAVGVSEGGFLILFEQMLASSQIGEVMLLCRGLSFYLPVLICGIWIVVLYRALFRGHRPEKRKMRGISA